MTQHTHPCKTCPFRRDVETGTLGGSPVGTFIGQAYGAFWIPCHECIDYTDPNWKEKYHANQCAGVAIYRANAHPARRPAALLNLPADVEKVFSSPEQFMAHHLRIPIKEALEKLKTTPPIRHWMNECARAGSVLIPKEAIAHAL